MKRCRKLGTSDGGPNRQAPGFMPEPLIFNNLNVAILRSSACIQPTHVRWYARLGWQVLHECCNPVCKRSFVNLGEGKLFRVQANDTFASSPLPNSVKKPYSRIEYFWLCGKCSAEWTLTMPPVGGVQLTGKRMTARARAAEI